jgi:two-component system sensor histidine kinase KdpD
LFGSQGLRTTSLRFVRILASAALAFVITFLAYWLHANAFVAGLLYLLLILPIAFQWGLLEATAVSVIACVCLDYFFTQPVFNFYMSDPRDWVALAGFETVVVVVSGLASRLRRQAAAMVIQQARVDRLYAMSRRLLLLEPTTDGSNPLGKQIVSLIAEMFEVRAAALWNSQGAKGYVAGVEPFAKEALRIVELKHEDEDNPDEGLHIRVLAPESEHIGILCLIAGSNPVTSDRTILDARAADAIASLAAIAVERERALLAETSAEASKQSERLRAAVLDGLAHAYKTPLATIQAASSGLIEIHKDDSLGEVDRELLATIQSEVEHLSDITSQALITARLQDREMKPNLEELRPQSLLQIEWYRLAPGLTGRRLEIQGADSQQTFWADQKLLQMALTQLLDNAAKYSTPLSAVCLRILITNAEAVFSVQNHGSYILVEEQERIFQRFYRSPREGARVAGTGIGLTVVKQIAEAHGGRVWVESAPGSGTTFFLALPNWTPEE